MTDTEIVKIIHELLDAREWSVDDLGYIADLLNRNGYPIRNPPDELEAEHYPDEKYGSRPVQS